MDDILEHNFLALDHHIYSAFNKPSLLLKKLEDKRIFKTNDSRMITKLILEGYGIGLSSNWEASELIKSQEMVLILKEDIFKPQGTVWLLSSGKRLIIPRIKTLFDYLISTLPKYL